MTDQRQVSGRYRGASHSYEVELRVDIDGSRPAHRVSADFVEVGPNRGYAGSMCVDEPAFTTSGPLVTITGAGRSTWEPDPFGVSITISGTATDARPPTAVLRHLEADGRVRTRYECTFESPSFRTVRLEEDSERGVERFQEYDTAALPAGCRPRVLSHFSAFEDAGIEMQPIRDPGVLTGSSLAANASWGDAELHAAMLTRFSAYADSPQWATWLLHAWLHDRDRGSSSPRLFGLMFDQRGRQRQGCALFYAGMAGTEPERRRIQLFTCVHELAHSFNLLHSFEKSLARPPVPSRPRSATWMAYPDLFPGGRDAFWRQFEFEFDDPEIVHLRHALRDDVIMGGNPFKAGAAFEEDAAAATAEDPGLRLTLAAGRSMTFGMPITVDLALAGTTAEGRLAPGVLGPRAGNVDVAIRSPQGRESVFEPLLRHCRVDDGFTLRAGDPPVLDSAFIHYGKDGFAFDTPGRYEVRARCTAPGGVPVLSNTVQFDVLAPRTRADRAAAALSFGEQQGILMSLVGSDAPQLRHGNDALRSIVERYPAHPLAALSRVVIATNAARDFKTIGPRGAVGVRAAAPQALASILRGTPSLGGVRGAAASGAGEAATARKVTGFLERRGRGAEPMIDAFLRSRSNEIATVVATNRAAMMPPPAPAGGSVPPVMRISRKRPRGGSESRGA
jgi:hypothetical protein